MPNDKIERQNFLTSVICHLTSGPGKAMWTAARHCRDPAAGVSRQLCGSGLLCPKLGCRAMRKRHCRRLSSAI